MTEPSGLTKYQKKRIPALGGIVFVLLMAYLLFSRPGSLLVWLDFIENKVYDLQVRRVFQPLPEHPPVAIVAIDDKSLQVEGRLPWSRKKMAELLDKLGQLDAKVVAFDFMFPQQEPNIAHKIIEEMEKKGQVSPELQKAERDFDYDTVFAASLQKETSILGMVFSQNETSAGVLPDPLLQVTPEMAHLYLPEKNSYLGNIAILQQAAKFGGFINRTPDSDGAVRFSPLIYRHASSIFGSLALMAVKKFLEVKDVKLRAKPYQEMDFLESIQLDSSTIPIDPSGRILIPFRGPALSFPMISATDILQGLVPKESIQGKLLFIGATATGSGDLVSTPISPSFPGVEVHATIAQGIIDHYLPYKPGWAKGVSVALILFLGLPMALFLPRLGPGIMVLVSGSVIGTLLLLNHWFWIHEKLVLSVFFPILVISLLFLFDVIYGYVIEANHRQAIRNIFGQYVSPEYIDVMFKKGGGFGMVGEAKELPIFFSDIRHFTSISEKMGPNEVKTFLNEVFTLITQIIFDHKGTIDKYIGDAIMAFWGAPLDDAKSSLHAVQSALAAQEKLKELNVFYAKENKPEVHIGIGIATGVVYVGDMGSKFRKSYTALGDTVNLASRLEGLTKHYSVNVIVSERVQELTKEFFLYRKLDSVQVKGKENAVVIYQPICALESASPTIKKEIELHNEALNSYAKGDWRQAREIWEGIAKASESKNFYALYLNRVKESAPPPDWSGVQRFETK